MSSAYRWLLSWVCLLLAACAGQDARPDLKRLYAVSTTSPTQPPVVLVHGVLGARLRDRRSGREVWPSLLARLAFSDFRNLALPVDGRADSLEPSGLFDAAAGRDFHGAIVRTLIEAGGYLPGELGQDPGVQRKRVYVFLYDWRQDNVHSAAALDAYIEAIRRDHRDPSLKLDMVAHSNGGLVAR